MARRKCLLCGQVTVHLNDHCTQHCDVEERPQTALGLEHRNGRSPSMIKPYDKSQEFQPTFSDKIMRDPREMPHGIRYTADSKIFDELGVSLGEAPPVKLSCDLFCSFCQEPVPADKATFGKGKVVVRAKLIAHIIATDPLEIKSEKYLTFRSDKLVACPKHSLFLLPTLEKCPKCAGRKAEVDRCDVCHGTGEGTKLVTHVKFPEFD